MFLPVCSCSSSLTACSLLDCIQDQRLKLDLHTSGIQCEVESTSRHTRLLARITWLMYTDS